MEEKLFSRILKRVQNNEDPTLNTHNDEEFSNFINILYEDISKFKNYTFDGRVQDIIYNVLKEFCESDIKYGQFLDYLEKELDKLVVPCIILIPLNYFNDEVLKSDLTLADNIKLFKTEKVNTVEKIKVSKTKSALAKHVETTIYAKLLKEHILLAKDRNFFNFPILAININCVDYQADNESSIITEAAYSFIRLLDFEAPREGSGWGILDQKKYPSKLYGVYYNKEKTSPKPPYSNGYGYSGRFKFSPYLDINSTEFIKQLDIFSNLLVKFCNTCFIDKRKIDKQISLKNGKWQKAVLLYNTAYELASIEKYDESLLLLIIILESLFLCNAEHNKRAALCNKIVPFMKDNYDIDPDNLTELIEKIYRKRNKFVHEGQSICYNYSTFKSITSYQGLIRGMKPFVYGGGDISYENVNLIEELFVLVGDVIKVY